MQYWLNKVGQIEYEERVKSFVVPVPEYGRPEETGRLGRVSQQAGRLLYTLRYRLSSLRRRTNHEPNPCLDTAIAEQSGC